jgi:hypothetical protein
VQRLVAGRGALAWAQVRREQGQGLGLGPGHARIWPLWVRRRAERGRGPRTRERGQGLWTQRLE